MIKKISGQVVDVIAGKIFPGEVVFENISKNKGKKYYQKSNDKSQKSKIKIGKIIEINKLKKADDVLILPGLIDAHIHVESSMLCPSRFAEMAVRHGTIGVVSDPHEIANVLGIDGINYMIKDGKRALFKFFWTVPSCVPATDLETSGAKLNSEDTRKLLLRPNFVGLSEMMNYPGAIAGDSEVLAKIQWAKKMNKPIDGHSPLLTGDDLKKYIARGITSDHECLSNTEAEEKIKLGMKIWAREGSAAKNLDDLIGVIKKYPEQCGLCSDDLHPDDLRKGHINLLIKKLIDSGMDPIQVMRLSSLNIIKHYNLSAGLLQIGDPADFVVADNWENLNIKQTWVNGQLAAKDGQAVFSVRPRKTKNNFKAKFKKMGDLSTENQRSKAKGQKIRDEDRVEVKVIEAIDSQLITNKIKASLPIDKKGNILPDIKQDILKIVVAERYGGNKIVVGFIKNFGLKQGAIASSVAHDSHNIVAVGTNDKDLVAAINEIIKIRGGVLVVKNGKVHNKINLTVGGLMSARHGRIIAEKYKKLKKNAKKLGSQLRDPFMTMSFMALLVIPHLKISDQGLFDVDEWMRTGINF